MALYNYAIYDYHYYTGLYEVLPVLVKIKQDKTAAKTWDLHNFAVTTYRWPISMTETTALQTELSTNIFG